MVDKAILKNIFTDPQWKQIGRRLWYAEIDGKKYGAVAATWNPQFGNYALNCSRDESNDPGQAPQRDR